MADDKKKEAASAAPAGEGGDGKKKGNLFLTVGIVVGILAIYAPVTYLLVPKPPANEEEIAQKAKEDSLRLVSEAATKMGAVTDDTPIDFVVNISGTEDRFLKASVVFEYDEKNIALGAELRKRAPTKYKDMLIKHMSSLSLTEITDPLERDKICKDLQRMINASLPTKMGEVRSVMFTTYITQ
ncbi:MAG: flagellar basal body-associated FliL family protein [Chitinispirillales bacterium]|jgi:flagellar basal body-associated protein FliL|nr:flagellar basal body-associated FliL family protein [Chitinispirillales bacterium]